LGGKKGTTKGVRLSRRVTSHGSHLRKRTKKSISKEAKEKGKKSTEETVLFFYADQQVVKKEKDPDWGIARKRSIKRKK